MYEIKVNVQIDVTPQVVSLVSAVLGKATAAPIQAPAAAVEAPAPAVEEKPTRKPRKAAAPVEAPQPEQAAEPAPAETPAPAADPVGDLPFASEDEAHEAVRAAMHETRQRIEGEDYKENTTSERYVKYHKKLTAVFKSVAKDLSGQEKPSALSIEQSGVFVEVCKQIVEAADGNVQTPKFPF